MGPENAQALPKSDVEVIKFSDTHSFNFAYVFLALAALVAAAGTFLLWSANNSAKDSLEQKQTEKDAIIAEISSPTYKDVEKNAAAFKTAVEQLKLAAADKYLISEFLPEFYKRITNDVQIENIAVADGNALSFDGVTKSYRSVADLLVALKSWPVLNNIVLTSVSLNQSDSGGVEAAFSITANIDKSKKLTETSETASSSTTATSNASEPTTSEANQSGGNQ